MILGERQKNSHEKFVLSVEGETIRLSLWKVDAKGAFKPTQNAFSFNAKHEAEVRALLDKWASERREKRRGAAQ